LGFLTGARLRTRDGL